MSKMLTSGISGILLSSKTIQMCVIEQCCENGRFIITRLVETHQNLLSPFNLCTDRHEHHKYVHIGMYTIHMHTHHTQLFYLAIVYIYFILYGNTTPSLK